MSSILTNNGAMVALQTLQSVNKSLGETQSQISTGKSVASAKDNAAIWAISKTMETDQSSFKVIQDGLNMAEATVSVGLAGAEQVTDILREMKDLAAGAMNDSADFDKIETDIAAKMKQIEAIIDSSQFNGINLLADTTDSAATSYQVLSSLDRVGVAAPDAKTISVDSQMLKTSIVNGTRATVDSVANAETALGQIEGFLDTAIASAAKLGSTAQQLSGQSDFVGRLADSMKSGIGALVDADMEEASARLQALQVQQQLSTQSLSIANQAPQSILSLFR
ncbi:Flagellin [Jannaschia seosinensis]|uniref:Flagellin n=1 Tax=Jannaschia seosinensis TaxID=313367 RepID=A0A0M7BE17_9RHOB|nr:flagellin [Jannaschia seosinensis]CUH40641.1 Flagellin [Jannaschia seosinensis]